MGKTYNRWTVIAEAGTRPVECVHMVRMVKARCACGTVNILTAKTLTRKNAPSKSCGCYRDQVCGRKLTDEQRARILG